ncbi:hypothetical protein [Micromonospora sp. KC723]|uniref:hypothetical protein n=1 Tax=Micromonospora sp. KC723 TaxID=2530381 RepID=UPI00104CD021|nr:hypothetical protein [Micromonospora sp. KC723]TDB76704.1 hypothetical protein E1165_06045 [Micromonospora sp. KC723]
MGEVLPMPGFGDLFTDLRADDRTMRVSFHPERAVVVLSLWRGAVCRGSFRMAVEEAGRLRALLEAIEAAAGPTADGTVGGEEAAEATEVVQTGDIAGTARRVASPVVPVPRVA